MEQNVVQGFHEDKKGLTGWKLSLKRRKGSMQSVGEGRILKAQELK